MPHNRGPEVAPGERWAYRKGYRDSLVEVEVVRTGVRTPKRVLVRFVDDSFEGLQDWVPPTRLQARWDERAAFVERERRWDAVASLSPHHNSPELAAAGHAIETSIERHVAGIGYGRTDGVLTIHDPVALAAAIGIDPAVLRADPLAFEEDGDLVVPWTTMLWVASRLVERDPDAVMRWVLDEEAEARREAVHGKTYPKRGKAEGWHVSAEACAASDAEYAAPVRALLRDWCGADAADLHDDLAAARAEVAVLLTLLSEAVAALRRGRNHYEAKRIEAELEKAGVRTPGR